jgi:hypothetical protein
MARRKRKQGFEDFDFGPYDDYDDDSDLDEFADLAKDFYSTDWEDPSGTYHRVSARRRIERRNELKDLYSEFDDWDDPELDAEW